MYSLRFFALPEMSKLRLSSMSSFLDSNLSQLVCKCQHFLHAEATSTSFYKLLASQYPALDMVWSTFSCHCLVFLMHLRKLTSATWTNSRTLGIEPGAAGCGSKHADHFAKLPPPPTSLMAETWPTRASFHPNIWDQFLSRFSTFEPLSRLFNELRNLKMIWISENSLIEFFCTQI